MEQQAVTNQEEEMIKQFISNTIKTEIRNLKIQKKNDSYQASFETSILDKKTNGYYTIYFLETKIIEQFKMIQTSKNNLKKQTNINNTYYLTKEKIIQKQQVTTIYQNQNEIIHQNAVTKTQEIKTDYKIKNEQLKKRIRTIKY